MKSNATGWLAFGMVAVLGIGIASCAISQSSVSPRSFIADNYDCDGDPKQRDSVRCESFGDAAGVVSDITREVQPIDTGVKDSTHYLQYEDDIVAVSEDFSGTRIEVDDYDDGARRHGSAFAVFGWSSFRPSGGSGGGGWGGGGK